MKRTLSTLAACALAVSILAGCAKSSSDQSANATASGPVTDSADSGLKPQGTPAGNLMGDPAHGAQIFSANCAVCHGQAGAGGGIGPVLKGEKSRKDYPAAIAWIKNPQAPMPKLFPSPLSEKDVDDVAAYVESL